MNFIKDRKNRIILLMVLLTIISTSYAFYYQFKWAELNYGDNYCWLWVIDENGNGFGDVVTHCQATKFNCESSRHNVPCKWIEGKTLVDTEGNELGRIVEGCECKFI